MGMKVMTMNLQIVKKKQQQTNFKQEEIYELQFECPLWKA